MAIQRCAQCGTARRGDLQVCVRCETPFPDATADVADVDLALPRPAAPSASQSHGTVIAALLVGLIVFALLLRYSLRDIGPFSGRIDEVRSLTNSAVVTVTVTNDGGRSGRANCNVMLVDTDGVTRHGPRFTSARLAPKASATQDVTVPLVEGTRPASVSC